MSARLNFRQIEAFRAVMLTGTTIAAANMLNTTQPSISRSLAQIQSAAKLKLFELDRGRLRPTPEAVMLFEAVQRNFLGLEAIEETVALLRRSGIGRLRVACTPALGMSVMPAVMARFKVRQPDVHITQFKPVDTGIGSSRIAGAASDVADRQQVASGRTVSRCDELRSGYRLKQQFETVARPRFEPTTR
ncbi:LysR family transcriptional regulator [Bradyrhizobium sp. CW7]|uniref:LysR family transcriptional regulator n=1 Tax=Bradyrhizobium sp. CW7 TaxID=2782688 RepID=UPI001FF9530B|nr:LysR family transcriptional regulator [Bradyrhizobium sp. CW7]